MQKTKIVNISIIYKDEKDLNKLKLVWEPIVVDKKFGKYKEVSMGNYRKCVNLTDKVKKK